MALPEVDPSLPSLPVPLFSDIDAARGDHLRANNQKIWENLQYLDDETIAETAARIAADAGLDSRIDANDADIATIFSAINDLSYVRRGTGDGGGSTNTQVIRFQTLFEEDGSNIVYDDDAVDGGAFIVQQDGIYSVAALFQTNGACFASINVGTRQDILATADNRQIVRAPGGEYAAVAWTGFVAAGEEIYILLAGTLISSVQNMVSVAQLRRNGVS